jgi:hypothetical protein
MTTVKSLAIVALLFGGTSLALAQTTPTTGPSPPANITTGPNGAPAYTSGHTAQTGHATKHKKMHMSAKGQQHKKMYMSAKSGHHKGLKTGQPQPKQPQ